MGREEEDIGVLIGFPFFVSGQLARKFHNPSQIEFFVERHCLHLEFIVHPSPHNLEFEISSIPAVSDQRSCLENLKYPFPFLQTANEKNFKRSLPFPLLQG